MSHFRPLGAVTAAFIAAISITTLAWAGGGPPPPHGQAITAVGKVLVDGSGMTLYVFDGDGRYRPTCAGNCAATWKPFQGRTFFPVGEPHLGTYGGYWTIIGRSDGLAQWIYGGRPLYHFSGDLNPGDINGEGAERGVWHVARVLCLPTDAQGLPNEADAVAVVDAALETGVSPLQELRRWCGVGLVELAQRSNIEVADLVAYEAGRKQLSVRETAAVANGLGIPVYLLLE